ncbi:Uncharacterized protein CLU1/cluA/TIF31 involved in mitochondrial morphology/distribution, also found associated with eIF-3 [Phaffia rhodozyma]|uniref:Uncharacterized protein CLU1/cluA/TIF31 involved in mitochondrial morphology/distribution, also found associated with eIF-3 n=1 Tax=Phaffia rhodozyma TaxID=264483 RepID=A0A0F7SHE6_PHARH|nr:Uncharacterized protein CLU1/cluA/TIF31 involved in mitochondrial morphology/distribution, also found associated with eIF-3 [Phaffia rhodozyma]
MADAQQPKVASDDEVVNTQNVGASDQDNVKESSSAETTEAKASAEEEDQANVLVFNVTINLPDPAFKSVHLPISTPEGHKAPPSKTVVVQTAALEILHELRLQVQDSAAGYWLGPFSFRKPVPEGMKKGDVVNTTKDGNVIKVGEKLSDYSELSEIFQDEIENHTPKVLDLVIEPFTENDARTQVLKLKEYLAQGSDAQDPSNYIISPAPSCYEMVRDHMVASREPAESADSKHQTANGSSKKATAKKGVKPAPVSTTAKNALPPFKLIPDEFPPFTDFDNWVETPLSTFVPRPAESVVPKVCLKSYGVSVWNPPPPQYRSKGHLLYLTVTTLEGETVQLTSSVRGWFINKSTSVSFDPFPRPAPKDLKSHSLFELLHGLSPLFSKAFYELSGAVETTNKPAPRELVATIPVGQAVPSHHWLVDPKPAVMADPLRQQLAFLNTGSISADHMDGARDWNEDIQMAREMPRTTMRDRVLREKHMARIQSEFTAACVRGAMTVARGEVVSLNPHEPVSNQMWLHRNIFYTKGVDSIESFNHLGKHEAAHIACGKDCNGIKALNQIDAEGAALLGHTVVDWAGDRWVCQSFLPGIFKRREDLEASEIEAKAIEDVASSAETEEKVAGEETEKDESIAKPHLIVYGADVDFGPNVVRWNAAAHKLMGKYANAFRLAEHEVIAGNQDEKVKLFAGSEVKVLNGTDGRSYVLDVYRLFPVDVEFLEKDVDGAVYTVGNLYSRIGTEEDRKEEAEQKETVQAETKETEKIDEELVKPEKYPHRMVTLRQELLDVYWEGEFRKWATQRAASRKEAEASKIAAPAEGETKADGEVKVEGEEKESEPKPKAPEEELLVEANGDIHVARANGDTEQIVKGGPSDIFSLRFNPDAFVDVKPTASSKKDDSEFDPTTFVPSPYTDESDPAIKAVRDASIYLRSIVIPTFVFEVTTGRESCHDGLSLTAVLHKKGINMRYLGVISANVDKIIAGKPAPNAVVLLECLQETIHHEMIFRASKHILRDLLKDQLIDDWSAIVSHFLNCLLGSAFEANPSPAPTPSPFDSDASTKWTELTPKTLRAQIEKEVGRRFRFALRENYLVDGLKKRQLLRELATRFAFQLAAREYEFEAVAAEDTAGSSLESKVTKKSRALRSDRTVTFNPEDVLALIPLVKHTETGSACARETLDTGKLLISRGDARAGLELMQEAIGLYENIHSVVHPDVARAYNSYAVLVHQLYRNALSERAADAEGPFEYAAELEFAVQYQRQAVIIAERVCGLDHYETLSFYQNLAMLETCTEDVDMTLKLFRHVIKLWDVTFGPNHPDSIHALTSVGNCLSMVSQWETASKVFKIIFDNTQEIFGPTAIQVAHASHALCQTMFCSGDLNGASRTSRLCADIFIEHLGEEDPYTKEAISLADAFERHKSQMDTTVTAASERAAAIAPQGQQQQQKKLSAAAKKKLIKQGGGLAEVAPTEPASAVAEGGKLGADVEAATSETAEAVANLIGARGHLEVEDLVKFISGDKPKSKKKVTKKRN